jgi:hypothetical protein
MASTREGRERGEAWAKQAVWGNIPAQLQAQFGSVDNITSRQFLELWRGRVEGGGQEQQQAPAPAVAGSQRGLDENMGRKLKEMIKAGGAPRAAAMAILSKYGPRDPVKLAEGEVLVDGNDPSIVLGRGQEKTHELRPGGTLVRGNQVVATAPNAPDKGENEEQRLTAQRRVREQTATQLNLQGDARTRYIATGQLGDDKGETEEQKVSARKRVAASLGWDANDPDTKTYIATGHHRGADRVGATELKLLEDAEEQNTNLRTTVEQLTRAKELNDKIYTGWGSSIKTALGTKLPGMLDRPADPRAKATEEWLKTMKPEAVSLMTSTLKGATTDHELRTFVEIFADPTSTADTRLSVIDRMMKLAERKMRDNQVRMDQIRGRTYTRPGGGQSTTQGNTSVTREQIESARQDPDAAIAEARRAVAQGRDKQQVIRRLQQLKVPVPGDL